MDITTRTIPVVRLPLRQFAVVALLVALLAAALAVYVGSQRHVPAPFGPARNGLIPYISNGEIYVGDPTTGKTRLLISSPRGTNPSAPGFSPDGTRLAFFRDIPSGPGVSQLPVDIYVVRDDGSELRRITASPFKKVVWAAWTPDGRQLAVIHPVDGVNQLDLLDADGEQVPVRLDAAVGADSLQFRPPDGRELLFRALVGRKYGLYVMNVDGTNKRTLEDPAVPIEMDQHLNYLSYTADGARILYQSAVPIEHPDGCCQLWVMNADGSDRHRFVHDAGAGWEGQAATSPDGNWVAFNSVLDGRSTQRVAIVRADGTGPVIRTGPELTSVAHWTWSPDSTKILMMPDEGGTGSGYLLDPLGGPATSLPWKSDLDIDWQRLALEN
jgi:Tol biopolymer transport system component